MFAIFLLPVCLTYWPRKYTTHVDFHVDNSHQVWSWYVHTLPNYSVFLSADTSRDLVSLTFDLSTLNICCAWRVTWPTLPPSRKTLRLSVLELRVITFPIGYHWKCVWGHCACAESRDPSVGSEKRLHLFNPDHDLSIHYTTSNIIKVICENNARPCVKRRMSFCACTKSRYLLKVP